MKKGERKAFKKHFKDKYKTRKGEKESPCL